MYRWDLNVAGVLDVGYTISQAQSMFTPLQHVRAAEQEERLCCVVCVCVCECGACVYTYIDWDQHEEQMKVSAGKINVQQQRYRFMCVLVHLGCDQPLPQKSALRCGHLWTRTSS